MSRIKYFLFLIILFISCDGVNDDLVCGTSDPLKDLKWLKERKESLDKLTSIAGYFIIQYQYEGSYVFLIDQCAHCSDGIKVVYNCDGEIICTFGGKTGLNTCPEFNTTATDSIMLCNATNHPTILTQ